jgi:hypothetical protein
MRRAETLNPAAFLINQDRNVVAAGALLQFRNQPRNLLRGFNVPFEQDETPGTLRLDERLLVGVQRRAGDSSYEGLGHLVSWF